MFRRKITAMGITAVISARKSPWQNPYVERVIGSIRRELGPTASSTSPNPAPNPDIRPLNRYTPTPHGSQPRGASVRYY